MLKGSKCSTIKCPMEKRNYPPGQHAKKQVKLSEYGKRLVEKQKLRNIMGITETQLRKYFSLAKRMKGVAGENLLKLLALRLDNVVYLFGWASSRRAARQLVSHGHVLVNGKTINSPSYELKVGDKVQLKEYLRENINVQKSVEKQILPSWLRYDKENFLGEIFAYPQREEISLPVNESLIVEFYSK
jgi:small subunit ribosomal protein S4